MLTIGAFLPHGVQIIPGIEPHQPESFSKLHQALIKVSHFFADYSPSTIVLITPHGIATDNHLGIYFNEMFTGTIAFDQYELPETFKFLNNIELASLLHVKALNHGHEVTRIVAGVRSGEGLLQWGELVPLYYTAHQLTPKPKIVVISTPLKRYENLDEISPRLMSFGQFLGEFIDGHPEKIALVASGDLSHVHDPKGPYGFHETSQQFDDIILRWLKGDDDGLLIGDALRLDKTAKSCGLAPLLILQGVFKVKNPTQRDLLAYGTPTYFGMAISMFFF